MIREFADHTFAPDADVCKNCGQTRVEADSKVCTMPAVHPMVCADFETDIASIRALQNWHKIDVPKTATGIDFPLRYGKEELISEGIAHTYVVNYMNAEAKRMLAAGYTPRMPRVFDTDEPVLYGFKK